MRMGEEMDAGNGKGLPSAAKARTCYSLHHRRSKSASDKKLEFCKHETSHGTERNHDESTNIARLRKSHAAQGSVYQNASCSVIDSAPSHRKSLENDVRQLQLHLHEERSTRFMLERAIGRAGSILSPGHRHFSAQTRELIAEIEILEEEIANREQHALSLYRSIFDQCTSGSPSTPSSGLSSPAQPKNEGRKHPSIISSAFCSSKKFPLQHFHAMASIKESGRNNGLLKPKVRGDAFSNESMNVRLGINHSDPSKLSAGGINCLSRTLKDHLYQCPSKLSEEMVRCLASIYYWMSNDREEKLKEAPSATLSRSSTIVVLPRRSADVVLPSRSVVEVSSISVDKNQISSASYALSSYRLLVEQLERVDLSSVDDSAKLAFWVNVYNSLIMHAYLAYVSPPSSLRRMALFHKWYESILSIALRKKFREEKQLHESKFGLVISEPLVIFALCTGAASDPVLRIYTAKNVKDELEKAKKEFLQANVMVRKSEKVFVPKILDRYAREAFLSSEDLLTWIRENADSKLGEAIQKCMDLKNGRKAAQVVEWLPYNARFHYIFARNLVGKQG